jgi:hypothetical protein
MISAYRKEAVMQKRTKFQIRSDASKQRWVRDDRKEAFWREKIAAWRASGKSKRAFCIERDLSQSSFNAWCREITMRDREKTPSASAQALLSPSAASKNVFVPLHLIGDDCPGVAQASLQAVTPSPAVQSSSLIEVIVPGGAVIRLEHNGTADFVAQLYSALKGQS